jgi:hypothetical protein
VGHTPRQISRVSGVETERTEEEADGRRSEETGRTEGTVLPARGQGRRSRCSYPRNRATCPAFGGIRWALNDDGAYHPVQSILGASVCVLQSRCVRRDGKGIETARLRVRRRA